MQTTDIFFDFHHHKPENKGIYSLSFMEIPAQNQVFSIGFHPKDIHLVGDKNWDWFYTYSQSPFCWAIGECGLDGLIDVSLPLQEEFFEKQIQWANTIRKPIIIHCVRQFSQLLKFKKQAEVPMIIHGFNKKQSLAEELLSAGFYLSFGKSVLYNEKLQELVAQISLDKIFLETDDTCFNIEILYQKVAELKQISTQELENRILKNLRNIKQDDE